MLTEIYIEALLVDEKAADAASQLKRYNTNEWGAHWLSQIEY